MWLVFEVISFKLLPEERWNAIIVFKRLVEPKSFVTSDKLLLAVICFKSALRISLTCVSYVLQSVIKRVGRLSFNKLT